MAEDVGSVRGICSLVAELKPKTHDLNFGSLEKMKKLRTWPRTQTDLVHPANIPDDDADFHAEQIKALRILRSYSGNDAETRNLS